MASKCDVISSPVYVTVEWNGRLWKESLNSDGPQYQQNKTITSHLNSLNTFEVENSVTYLGHAQKRDGFKLLNGIRPLPSSDNTCTKKR